MKPGNIIRIGTALSLTAAVVCLVIALLPEKSGIRIPVHCANGHMGYIDETGRMVLAAKWTRATPFSENGMAYVTSEHHSRKYDFKFHGFVPKFRTYVAQTEEHWKMDRVGNISSYRFVQASQRHPADRPTEPDARGMIMIRERQGVRWVMTDGSEAFPGRWEAGVNFKNDDPAAVCRNGRWGFINRKGEPVTPIEWEQTPGFDGRGRACVSVNNKWGVINTRGDLVVPLYFNYLAGFDDQNLCAATLESGGGFIDPVGKIIIPFRYVRVDSFDRFDMAKVLMRNEENNLRVGWIDRAGKQVIPCIYHDYAPEWDWRFKAHELLPVCDQKGFGLIDRKGRVVIPTGAGTLAHVEDPIAPGRFWITKVPGGVFRGPPPAFKPACYDQSGMLIWQGMAWTRAQTATGLLCFFGFVSAIMLIIMKRKRAAGHSSQPQPG